MAAPNVGRPAQAGYAGDLSATDAWALLQHEPKAFLIDVRTAPEWSFVGVADLSALGKKPVLVPWQTFPTMDVNPSFEAELAQAGVAKDAPVVFMCRSGGRSKAAAVAMTTRGFQRCYNLADGFEGPLDGARHRGTAGGWKAAGLPWAQS